MDINLYSLYSSFYLRWPPHINLTYPFVAADRFEEVANMLVAELRDIEPFDVQLNRFGTFGGSKKGVCYLAPETDPSDQLGRLYARVHAALSRAMPCPHPSKFTPHLTVAHTHTAPDAQEAADAAAETWRPVSFRVSELYILLRAPPTDQYCIACRIPLGAGLDGTPLAPTFGDVQRFPLMPMEEEDWVKDVSRSLAAQARNNRSKKK
jgi:2'-5' RNA ligase